MNSNETLEISTFFRKSWKYLSQNWSIIPVWGVSQPDSFKVAAVRWSPFQHRLPTEDEIHHWFVFDGHKGVGIVTGRLSQLAILDLDESELCRQFTKGHPHLTNTYTVTSPNGTHLYFEIPAHCTTKTRKGQGVDWLFEGCYAVAPPTQGYSAQNDQKPLILSQEDISTIESFLGEETPVITRNEPTQNSVLSLRDLTGYYSKHAQHGNRNTALFNTALMARDHGYNQQAVITALADVHANNRHRAENPVARHREAVATIKSAFSRPPRPIRTSTSLPNTIKEALMARGWTYAVRVIEALRQLGYANGTWLCRKEIIRALENIVGKHSVINTITTILDTDEPLFDMIKAHLPPDPHEPKGSAINTSTDTIIKCNMISVSKSDFSQMGRKTHFYKLPTDAELAEKLGVKLSRIADPLDLDDLKSAKHTRKALHRKYIERRPGQYPSKWLAKRLGVTKVTKNRYDKEIPDLHKRPEYDWKRLHWGNLNEIPEFEMGGVFLEDEQGKHYPAKRALAGKLMKQKHQLKLMKQMPNSYWIGSKFDAPQPQAFRVSQPVTKSARKSRHSAGGLDADKVAAYWREVYSSPASTVPQRESKPTQIGAFYIPESQRTQVVKHDEEKASRPHEHNPRRRFDIDYMEDAAQHLKAQINQQSRAGQHISLVSMRRLIVRYGLTEVRRVAKRVLKREDVEHPAGLLTTILRSEALVRELKSG